MNLSVKTNPFLTEKQLEFWIPIEERVRATYNVHSLFEYLENEQINGQTFTDIAYRLHIEPERLYRLLKRTGPLSIKKRSRLEKESKTNSIILKDLQDIINLDIKPINSLGNLQRKYWYPIEQKLIQEGKAPSLPAYLLYEHHFKWGTLRELGKEFGRSHQAIANLMKKLGIPSRFEVYY